VFYVAERRQAEANRIREKYPDRIPVSLLQYLFPRPLLISMIAFVLIEIGFLVM
jgi:hypothetical protein